MVLDDDLGDFDAQVVTDVLLCDHKLYLLGFGGERYNLELEEHEVSLVNLFNHVHGELDFASANALDREDGGHRQFIKVLEDPLLALLY